VPPLAGPDAAEPVDVVLLSHDEHADNLDHAGRALLGRVPLVLTTPSAAGRLGGAARGLAPWESVELERPAGGTLTVTAVPARHGPVGCEPFTGEVTGFVLTGDGLPTVYVSGDNASLDLVRRIAARSGPIDTAVLFAGGARAGVLDNALLTLDSAQAAEAAAILGVRRVVAVHLDSWAHFTEGRDTLVKAFEAAGLAELLRPDN
jgi:L-ascorbate metabolism protein UlaG (beta-lactamase superfamily)